MVAREKNKINRELGKVLKPIYFDQIPLDDIFDVIRHNGYLVVDEEGNSWSGILCGREATVFFDLNNGLSKTPVPNAKLCLQWYKMQSGRYEITAYVG